MRKFLRLLSAFLVLFVAIPAIAAVPTSKEQINLSFAPIVKKTNPSVVNIYAKKIVEVQQRSRIFNDPFFNQFFGNKLFSFGAPREKVQNSLGSGVIIDEKGLIVTNAHVIDGASQITVVLNDRREFPSKIIAVDKKTDLAVLKIDAAEKLPALTFGSSESLEVGDLVVAIGNPFGVGQTVTSGIVSALARTTVGISDYQFFIQTDAAINPGNSGGALVDMNGDLIGINSAIYSRDGGSLGIGFAIPVEMVKAVVAGLTTEGKVVRPWLGASGQPVTQDIAESLGLSRPVGVLINDIYPNSPAEKAGLKVGDVVTTVAGKEVEDIGSLRYRLATMKVGDSTQMDILRNSQKQSLTFALQPPPEVPVRDTTILDANPFIGLQVSNISPAVIEEMDLDMNDKGVIVTGIQKRSPVSQLPIQRGDTILQINKIDIDSVANLRKILKKQSQKWIVVINRNNRKLTLTIE